MTRNTDYRTEDGGPAPGQRTDLIADGDRAVDPPSPADRSGTLEHVRRAETIADRVDFAAVRAELPAGWEVVPDLVQFGPEPLSETVRFRRTPADPQVVLKPADPAAPAGGIEFHERAGAQAKRRRTLTAESLAEALRVAVTRVHQLDG